MECVTCITGAAYPLTSGAWNWSAKAGRVETQLHSQRQGAYLAPDASMPAERTAVIAVTNLQIQHGRMYHQKAQGTALARQVVMTVKNQR